MDIRGYLQTSLIEWPGKISSVIFVPGCNFRCPFCHNSNLVDSGKVSKLQSFREDEVLADLEKRKKWIDGVVVTGGEPLLQPDLSGFLRRLKRMGFETMVETNGSKPEALKLLIADSQLLIDFIAMDYKTTFGSYEKVVCMSLEESLKTLRGLAEAIPRSGGKLKNKKEVDLAESIKKSMKLILSSGLPFEFRTTVVPGIHDEKVLVEMAQQLKQLTINNQQLANLTWVLQNFRPKNCLDPEFNKKKPYDVKNLEGFLRAVKKIIPGVELRGI